VTIFPVLCNVVNTSATVAVGFAAFNTAHAPATCGAAIDVPLIANVCPPGTEETISTPGASKLNILALLEDAQSVSALSVAPTLIAEEIHAGAAIPSL
jgi:hypothetical protein